MKAPHQAIHRLPEVDIKPKQRAFDAAAIRLLGFDPTRIDQSLAHDNEDEASKQRRVSQQHLSPGSS